MITISRADANTVIAALESAIANEVSYADAHWDSYKKAPMPGYAGVYERTMRFIKAIKAARRRLSKKVNNQ